MSRLIDADELSKWISGQSKSPSCPKNESAFGLRIIKHIDRMPSVQPVDKDINVPCKDAISRQDAIDAVDKLSDKPIGYLESAIDVLVDLPSVQPDIIACGDCKHYIPHDKRCGYWNHGVQPLMWCSQAERRTDGFR